MEKLRFVIRAFLGGIMIGIGGTVYLMCSNTIVGSFLFCVGLFTICVFGLALYTGMAGYVLDGKWSQNYVNLLLCWLGNFAGCLTVALLVRTNANVVVAADSLAAAKLAKPIVNVFCTSILCGALMFIAVENYRSSEAVLTRFLGMLFCVPVFILAGFEHSVANMFFLSAAAGGTVIGADSTIFAPAANGLASLSVDGILLIVIASVGNLVGGLGFKQLWTISKQRS